MGALFLLLQLTAGRGSEMIAALPQPAWALALAAPVALAWMCLDAGLTEEFLFRVAFQARAASWLGSETGGVVVMAVLFGLAHAPGYVLRGAHAMEGFATVPDPLTAGAYSIVVVSATGSPPASSGHARAAFCSSSSSTVGPDFLPKPAVFVTTRAADARSRRREADVALAPNWRPPASFVGRAAAVVAVLALPNLRRDPHSETELDVVRPRDSVIDSPKRKPSFTAR